MRTIWTRVPSMPIRYGIPATRPYPSRATATYSPAHRWPMASPIVAIPHLPRPHSHLAASPPTTTVMASSTASTTAPSSTIPASKTPSATIWACPPLMASATHAIRRGPTRARISLAARSRLAASRVTAPSFPMVLASPACGPLPYRSAARTQESSATANHCRHLRPVRTTIISSTPPPSPISRTTRSRARPARRWSPSSLTSPALLSSPACGIPSLPPQM